MKTHKPFGPVAADRLRLSLCDRNSEVAEELASCFRHDDAVEVVQGHLFDLDCDGVVSPANSFGDMSGGIDKVIDDFHGGAAQTAVRAAIERLFLGELPVGAAVVVELSARRFPFVVAAPTMRIPATVHGSINAYLAMRAALVAVLRHNAKGRRPIRTLAVPGLGTGVGGMDVGDAAEQMRTAYDNVMNEGWRRVIHPALAPYVRWRTR